MCSSVVLDDIFQYSKEVTETYLPCASLVRFGNAAIDDIAMDLSLMSDIRAKWRIFPEARDFQMSLASIEEGLPLTTLVDPKWIRMHLSTAPMVNICVFSLDADDDTWRKNVEFCEKEIFSKAHGSKFIFLIRALNARAEGSSSIPSASSSNTAGVAKSPSLTQGINVIAASGGQSVDNASAPTSPSAPSSASDDRVSELKKRLEGEFLVIPIIRPNTANQTAVPPYMNKVGKWVSSLVESVGKDRVKSAKKMVSEGRTLDMGSMVRYLFAEGFWNEVRRKYDSAFKKYEEAHRLILQSSVQDYTVPPMDVLYCSEYLSFRIRRLRVLNYYANIRNTPSSQEPNAKVYIVNQFREQYRWYTSQLLSSVADLLRSRLFLARQCFSFGKILCEKVLTDIVVSYFVSTVVEYRCQPAFYFRAAANHMIESQAVALLICNRNTNVQSAVDVRSLSLSFAPEVAKSFLMVITNPGRNIASDTLVTEILSVIGKRQFSENVLGLLKIQLDSIPVHKLRLRSEILMRMVDQQIVLHEWMEALEKLREVRPILRKDYWRFETVYHVQKTLFCVQQLIDKVSQIPQQLPKVYGSAWQEYVLSSMEVVSSASLLPFEVRKQYSDSLLSFMQKFSSIANVVETELSAKPSLVLDPWTTVPLFVVEPSFSAFSVHVGDKLQFKVKLTVLLPPECVRQLLSADLASHIFPSLSAEFRGIPSLKVDYHSSDIDEGTGLLVVCFACEVPTVLKTFLSLKMLSGSSRFAGLPLTFDASWYFTSVECYCHIHSAPSLLDVSFDLLASSVADRVVDMNTPLFVNEACRVRVTIRSPREHCGGGTYSIHCLSPADTAVAPDLLTQSSSSMFGNIPTLNPATGDVDHVFEFVVRSTVPGMKSFSFEGVYASPRDSKCIHTSSLNLVFAWPFVVGVDVFKTSSNFLSTFPPLRTAASSCYLNEPTVFSVFIKRPDEGASPTSKPDDFALRVFAVDCVSQASSLSLVANGTSSTPAHSVSEHFSDAVLCGSDSLQSAFLGVPHKEGTISPFTISVHCCRVFYSSPSVGKVKLENGHSFILTFRAPEVIILSRPLRVRFAIPAEALCAQQFDVVATIENLAQQELSISLQVDPVNESGSIVVQGVRIKTRILEPSSSIVERFSMCALQAGCLSIPSFRVSPTENLQQIMYDSSNDNLNVFIH
eukprot:ANDGO_05740.mRNA.1 hypothetical protein